MNYSKLYIYLDESLIDIAISMMTDIGISGFEIENGEDFNEFINKKDRSWDYIDESLIKKFDNIETKIILYLPKNKQGEDVKIQLENLVKNLMEKYETIIKIIEKDVKEEDWENNWKVYFKPFKVGKTFVIKPSWENYERQKNQKIIEIDPGSSFGTGQHSTTKLCLEAIEKYVKKGYNVLDMGCGSGILSIAALLNHANHVLCLDIDENSVKITSENLSKNNFNASQFTAIKVYKKVDSEIEKMIKNLNCDLILANIVADVLINLSDDFYRYLKKGKILIASGIIEEREEVVKNAFLKSGFSIHEINRENGWVCIVAKVL